MKRARGGRPRPHRNWKQRALLITGTLVSLVSLLAAMAVFYIGSIYSGIDRITIVHASPGALPPEEGAAPTTSAAVTVPGATTSTTEPDPGKEPAMNVLMTGSDGRNCVDPKSPYAGAFLGSGSNIGNRSDTILLMRVDPSTGGVAMLSFPRDLWIPIAGTNYKSKINSAFDPNDPNRLIQTIEANFKVHIDHYVGVDFCAFKSMVDAVDGVQIPFPTPVRDTHTGLYVPEAGCRLVQGDEALAYVRSRYYEYQVNGRWQGDGTSDYGRINRQQDFIRRLMQRAIDKGITNPLVAKRLLDVAKSNNVRIDDELSLTDIRRLANSLKGLAPGEAASYRIEGKGQLINGASVIVPAISSEANQAILAVFRGEKPVGATVPPDTADTASSTPGTAAAGTTAATTVAPEATAVTTAPAEADATTVATDSNMIGVAPPSDAVCP